MDNKKIEEDLKNIFILQPDKEYLKTRESSTVEFKVAFHRESITDYIKDFAAFANNIGGYIIFGVQNLPHIPLGLQNNKFNEIDDESITQIANEHFTPAMEWERHIYEWNGNVFGILHIFESSNKPIIAIKTGGKNQQIKDGEVYFRYRARTEKIHYAELKNIIDEKIERERKVWFELLEKIAKIGPENAAILDTIDGKIEKGNNTILIDDELLPKLKFIKEGKFRETEGAITLRLIGDVQPVSVVGFKEKIIHDDPFRLRATNVALLVAQAINNKFRASPEHFNCWQYYNIRSVDKDGKITCNPEFCDYKEALKIYMYTEKWVEFLIKELSNSDTYNNIMSLKKH